MRLFFLFIIFSYSSFAQFKRAGRVPEELKEISGLEQWKDFYLAINDSGNEPLVYVLKDNAIHHTVRIKNARNVDWEDIALSTDGKFLYIADLGNNLQARRNLIVYQIRTSELNDTVANITKAIKVRYPEQTAFPPKSEEKYYDCEAITCIGIDLFIFTKNNTKPYDGICKVYKVPENDGSLIFHSEIVLGTKGYFQNSVTAADFAYGKLFLSTYSGLYEYIIKDNQFKFQRVINYPMLTQKEAIVAKDQHTILIADEKSPIFVGRNFYTITIND